MFSITGANLVKVQEELNLEYAGGGKECFATEAQAFAHVPGADGQTVMREVESNLVKDGVYRIAYPFHKRIATVEANGGTNSTTLKDGRSVVVFTIGRQSEKYHHLEAGLVEDAVVEMILSEPGASESVSESGRFSAMTWQGLAEVRGSHWEGFSITLRAETSSDNKPASFSEIDGLKLRFPRISKREHDVYRYVPLHPQNWEGFCLCTEESENRPAMTGATRRGTATATYFFPRYKLTFKDEASSSSA